MVPGANVRITPASTGQTRQGHANEDGLLRDPWAEGKAIEWAGLRIDRIRRSDWVQI